MTNNDKKRGIYKNALIAVVALFVIVSAVMNTINATPAFKYVFILPIAHGLLMLLFSFKAEKMFEYPTQIIVYAGLFIRNVLTPLLLSGSYSIQKIRIENQEIVNLAILLMIYETLVIFVVLARLFEKDEYFEKYNKVLVVGNYRNVFSVVLVLILVISVGLWFLVPDISMRYSSIFKLDTVMNIAANVNKENLSSSSRGLYTLGTMLINICRYLLSTISLVYMRRISERSFFGIIATIGVLIANLFLVSTEIAVVFFCALYIFLISTKLWPDIKGVLVRLFATGGSVGVFFLAFIKSGMGSTNDFFASMGSILQAYFPGIFNMCGTISLPKGGFFDMLFADLYSIIPFRNSVFGLQVTNTSDLFNTYNGIAGQIVPLVGESYYLFGALFAPLLSGLFVHYSIKISKKMRTCNDMIQYSALSLATIYLSIGTTCYNFILIGQTFTALIVPIMLLSYFSHDKYYIREEADDNLEA